MFLQKLMDVNKRVSQVHMFVDKTSAILLFGFYTTSSTIMKCLDYHYHNFIIALQWRLLSSSGPDHVQVMSRLCPGHVQVMSRSCPGHVQVISYPSPSQISRSGPGADSIIAMPLPPTHQQTFLIEITQISLQAVTCNHKGRFRLTSGYAH